MKRKIVYSIIIATIMFICYVKVFAAGSSSDMGNSVKNTADTTMNAVENGAEHVGNALTTEGEMIGNVTRSATNGVMDAGERVANGTENVARGVTNQTAANPNAGNTIFGLTNVAWMWIIIAIVFAVLIWIIYKYMKEKKDE